MTDDLPLAIALFRWQCGGLVARHVFPTRPPQVEYRLSALGGLVLQPLAGLVARAEHNHPAIRQARNGFDALPMQVAARPQGRAGDAAGPDDERGDNRPAPGFSAGSDGTLAIACAVATEAAEQGMPP